MAPAYLAADCQLSSEEGHRRLRSANSRSCVVRRTYRNFGIDILRLPAGPKLWPSLPAGLRQTDIDYEQSKRLLKTYLFGHYWDRADCDYLFKLRLSKFSYLFTGRIFFRRLCLHWQFTGRALAHHLIDPLGGPSTRYFIALGLLYLQMHDMDKVEENIRSALQIDYQVSLEPCSCR